MKHHLFSILLIGALLVSCKVKPTEEPIVETPAPTGSISSVSYGMTRDSLAVEEYTLKNKNGMEVKIITYGGIITSWTAPDKDGNYKNIVLGYDNLAQYQRSTPYFGALIGRYGNRIAKGMFTLDGNTYQLPKNDGQNHLHGGPKGFDKVVWTVTDSKAEGEGAVLKLKYLSPDMQMGYPGNLEATVTYTLTGDNALEVDYAATTDKTTVVNLTQHSYFNLSGDFSTNILDHELTISASKYLPVDGTLIPTGELATVSGTPFDFTSAKVIGTDITAENEQLKRGKGYDHCWVVDGEGMRLAASVYHPASGRVMEISSNEPGIQFYSGNFLDGRLPVPGGGTYGHRSGLCLETQHFPDSPNQPAFPTTTLKPGETYSTKTIFKFTTK